MIAQAIALLTQLPVPCSATFWNLFNTCRCPLPHQLYSHPTLVLLLPKNSITISMGVRSSRHQGELPQRNHLAANHLPTEQSLLAANNLITVNHKPNRLICCLCYVERHVAITFFFVFHWVLAKYSKKTRVRKQTVSGKHDVELMKLFDRLPRPYAWFSSTRYHPPTPTPREAPETSKALPARDWGIVESRSRGNPSTDKICTRPWKSSPAWIRCSV